MQSLLSRVTDGLSSQGRALLSDVSAFSRKHLSSIHRRTGESYAEHGHQLAAVLREVMDDAELLGVAVLHDLPLHENGAELLRLSPLTPIQRTLVGKMHELRRLHIDAETKDLDTVLQAFVADHRLLPLRMAHRLNDVRHLKRFSAKLRKQIAHETLHMYAAIAGRLSMHAWRHEMEDTCFKYLQPAIAGALEKKFAAHAKNDALCLEHVGAFVQKHLQSHGILPQIFSRTKTLYSTYRKMAVKRRKFEDLTDRLALRVVVPTVDDCYRALGIVHSCLHPIPGKLKDYIGAPKENGYRSIHTVVYPMAGVSEYPVEIQIRSVEMHQACEFGSARHADYKHCLYGFHSRFARVDLFSNLLVLREAARSPDQFKNLMRTYFNEKQIALFDPKNNLWHLPSPVTCLDFACHTAGKRVKFLKSVRVNGRHAPQDAELRDGDTVECSFGRGVTLKPAWLKACKQTASRKLLRSLLQPE